MKYEDTDSSYDDSEPASRKMARWWVTERRKLLAHYAKLGIACFGCKYKDTCRQGKKTMMNITYGIMGVQR